MNRGLAAVCVIALVVAAACLQCARLGSAPPYLSIEEVGQAHDAVLLATTGRNADGQLLPVYFPDNAIHTVRDPVWVYWAAALLTFLPFSEALVRAPSACAAVLDVILMFLVVRELL